MADFTSLTHKFRANLSSLPSGGHKVSKRNRQPLSCVPCRVKKLKCDRGHPCETCLKRGDQDSCTYGKIPPGAAPTRPEPGSDSAGINGGVPSRGKAQERLRHLEQLVMRMVDSSTSGPTPSTIPVQAERASTLTGSAPSSNPDEGNLQSGPSESQYVRSTHWSAILENIQELKTALGVDYPSSTEPDDSEGSEAQESEDLFASSDDLSLAQILAHSLPPRVQVDRRLSTYFNARYMVVPFIHAPHFQRQYEQFWQTPLETSPLWVSILFCICCISATLGEIVGSESSTPEDERSTPRAFLAAAGQCLQLGGYVRPKRYAVEALVLYARCKYMVMMDPSREAGTLMAIVVRLAYRSGYHRDPSHFPHLSVFEGELRRRTWLMCQQCDLMVAFQMGLPNLIPPDTWDTRPPRNLLDTDFDEHTTILPPSRPEEEPTELVYFIAKSRLMTAFAKICIHALSFRESSQQEVMALDAEMRAVHGTMPNVLRIRPMAQSFADPSYLIMLRLNCEFLFQKSLCVLHRKYLTQGAGKKYAESRKACLDAATAIIKHMLDMHKEFQPGGQLYADRWMLNSFTMNDFYLACMILCLGLSTWKKANPGKLVSQDDGMKNVLELLQASLVITEERSPTSHEARRVTAVLRVALGQTGSCLITSTPPSQPQHQDGQQQQQQQQSSTIPTRSLQSGSVPAQDFFAWQYNYSLAPLTLNEESASDMSSSVRDLRNAQPQTEAIARSDKGSASTGFLELQSAQSNPHRPYSPNPLTSFLQFPTDNYQTARPVGTANQITNLNGNPSSNSGTNTSTPYSAQDVHSSSNPSYANGSMANSTSNGYSNRGTDLPANMGMNTNPNFGMDVDVTANPSANPSSFDIDWAFLDQWMNSPGTDPIMPLTDDNLPFGSPSMLMPIPLEMDMEIGPQNDAQRAQATHSEVNGRSGADVTVTTAGNGNGNGNGSGSGSPDGPALNLGNATVTAATTANHSTVDSGATIFGAAHPFGLPNAHGPGMNDNGVGDGQYVSY